MINLIVPALSVAVALGAVVGLMAAAAKVKRLAAAPAMRNAEPVSAGVVSRQVELDRPEDTEKSPEQWPAEVAESPPMPRRSRRLVPIALGAGLFLCFIGSFAAVTADYGLPSDSGPGTPTPGVSTQTSSGQAGPTPSERPTSSGPTVNPQAGYTVAYTDESMRVVANCDDPTHVDLDEPRVGVDATTGDVSISQSCTSQQPSLTLAAGVTGSKVDSASITPAECTNAIRLAPMLNDPQAVRKGQVFCVATSLVTARSLGQSRKIVVLNCSAVGQDGAVTLEATAWTFPE